MTRRNGFWSNHFAGVCFLLRCLLILKDLFFNFFSSHFFRCAFTWNNFPVVHHPWSEDQRFHAVSTEVWRLDSWKFWRWWIRLSLIEIWKSLPTSDFIASSFFGNIIAYLQYNKSPLNFKLCLLWLLWLLWLLPPLRTGETRVVVALQM